MNNYERDAAEKVIVRRLNELSRYMLRPTYLSDLSKEKIRREQDKLWGELDNIIDSKNAADCVKG